MKCLSVLFLPTTVKTLVLVDAVLSVEDQVTWMLLLSVGLEDHWSLCVCSEPHHFWCNQNLSFKHGFMAWWEEWLAVFRALLSN